MKKTKMKNEAMAVADAPLPTPIGEFKVLRRDQVRPDPNQPRKVFDETKLAEMSASIRAQGIIQPILVRWVPAELKLIEPDMANDSKWQAINRLSWSCAVHK